MNWLQSILEYFEQKGVGEQGIDLFRNHMPAQVESGVLLVTLMPIATNGYARKYHIGTLQIVARDKTVDAAVGRANSVIGAIGDGSMDLPGVRVLRMAPSHLPLPYPRTAGGFEASVNCDLNFVLKQE